MLKANVDYNVMESSWYARFYCKRELMQLLFTSLKNLLCITSDNYELETVYERNKEKTIKCHL